ncbi:MAG: PKD domain-containing protein [Candidatus Cloacimonetes bacterium]|nr:PKD domain-containing protein [Candidatus Cloacimonadota bacterium]
MKRTVIVVLLLSFMRIYCDVPFRLMTYNTLRLAGSSTSRIPHFCAIINQINPDIILLQEIVNAQGVDLLLSALNEDDNEYVRADFFDGYDTDNAMIYRESLVTVISQDYIPTMLREFAEYRIEIAGQQIRVYSCHLKAGAGTAERLQRLEEVTILREHLNQFPEDEEFIICGDMNFYFSDEPGYQKFMADEEINIGKCEDTTDLVGYWHDNPDYAIVHTQSSRGGNNGGIDDRFDFIITSFGINNNYGIEYVENSLVPYGNDGLHLNLGVAEGDNLVVSPEIAASLASASDHLPVYANFFAKSMHVDFTADTVYGGHPLIVNFTDLSLSDITTWEWDFQNDGVIDSSEQHPQWIYQTPGYYSVKLTISNEDDSASNLKSDYIHVVNIPPEMIVPLGIHHINEDEMISDLNLLEYFFDANNDGIQFYVPDEYTSSISLNENLLTIIPPENWYGNENIAITADDFWQNRTSRATFTDTLFLVVHPVNDPPIIEGYLPEESSFTMDLNSYTVFSIEAGDIDSNLDYQWLVNEVVQDADGHNLIYIFVQNGLHSIICRVSDEEYSLEVNWLVTVDDSNSEDVVNYANSLVISPNPFCYLNSPELKANFSISDDSKCDISIYDIKGRKVVSVFNGSLHKGNQEVVLNKGVSEIYGLSSGVYFIRLQTDYKNQYEKFIILK